MHIFACVTCRYGPEEDVKGMFPFPLGDPVKGIQIQNKEFYKILHGENSHFPSV